MGVHGAGDHLAADLSELFGLVAEGDDLSWAHEGEVQGIEEKNHILSLVVR